MRAALGLFLALWALLAAAAPQRLDGSLRLTYEDLRLPGDEWMGLVGLGRHLAVGHGAYAALAAYGAVTGRRGGFFTGGFELGWQRRWRAWEASAGLFLGGGGGGAAPQGGGLMLRPHAGVARVWGAWSLGVQGSWVRFPNGAIDSRQLALSVERRWPLWLASGWRDGAFPWPARAHRQWFGVQSSHYFPRPGTVSRGGRPLERVDLIGVRWRPHLHGPWYLDMETAGAWGGGVDGYAQVLAGPSLWRPLRGRSAWGGGLMLGAAGGGTVDTGGGIVGRAWAGLSLPLSGRWSLDLNGGVTAAREGGFTAATVTAGLLHGVNVARPVRGTPAPVAWHRWRVRPAWQRYFGLGVEDRKSARLAAVPVDLVGIKLERILDRGLYLGGQAWGAFDGGAGGYAVGFWGVGWERRAGPWRPWLELDLGAAGGGGMAVGPGVLAQPMLGLSRVWGRVGSLSFALGRVHALAGPLSAWVLEAALSYRFSTPGMP